MSEVTVESRPTLARHVRLQQDAVRETAVLLYPEGVLELNPTAHEIVQRCDGKTSVAEIVGALAAEYEASPEDLRDDVLECVAQLHVRNFLLLAS